MSLQSPIQHFRPYLLLLLRRLLQQVNRTARSTVENVRTAIKSHHRAVFGTINRGRFTITHKVDRKVYERIIRLFLGALQQRRGRETRRLGYVAETRDVTVGRRGKLDEVNVALGHWLLLFFRLRLLGRLVLEKITKI